MAAPEVCLRYALESKKDRLTLNMDITNNISIKQKTYLLVLLSVAVALILSLVSYNGLDELRNELDDLVFATKIERFTNKLIVEEQRYRLNANGSVHNLETANQSFKNTIQYVNAIYETLNNVDQLNNDAALQAQIQNTKESTDKYKALYLKGVNLLTELNKQAETLIFEGEVITLQMQEYVEAKRADVKKIMTQKTIEKINNGSNIWQFTYVTRLEENKYRLSPSEEVFDTYKHAFSFMMSEWDRLKGISNQPFEVDKLQKFHTAAKRYEYAMLRWVSMNKELVNKVLPSMKLLGGDIIRSAILSAELSVKHILEKRDAIALVLFSVTAGVIVLGMLFGAAIVRSISTAISSFQNGLLNFFQYLNHQQETALPITIHGRDEISVMAKVVNENISKIQSVLSRKVDYQKALLEWSRVDYKNEALTISRATELSAKALHVDRVSIWLFNDHKTKLTCADLYLKDSDTHQSGAVLSAEDYPKYFEAIIEGGILAASEARNDERTREFTEAYLVPLNIYSMLDLAIIHDDQLVGVICHEKTGNIKNWEHDEEEFAGTMVNAISLSLEIKKRHCAQEELRTQKELFQYHANHDPLTNLPNRFLFNDRLKQTIRQAERNKSKVAVLFIDLDHFKGINDSMGHEVGDELLIQVATRLKTKIRQTDTLARLGGDEFSLVLGDVDDSDSLTTVTKGLLNIMDSPIVVTDKSFYISLSIGIAIYPEDGTSPEELLKNADAAMYQAKDDGRNNFRFYAPSMTEKALKRVTMEASFRNALKNEEFVVYYQPQVDASTGKTIGTEALVRWMHPDKGLLTPSSFLPFAHETGLVIPMDQWVMITAMTQYAQWYQQGLEPGILSLNLSMSQLNKDDFVTLIHRLTEITGCNPKWLEFELTEGQIMEDPIKSVEILHKVRELGISLAIDDFGTGYSSLSQLKRLPINKLKIDRSFICELPDDEEDVVLSKSVISLARNMKLSVIAEGVETHQQKDFLLKNHCDFMQGYLFSRPVAASDMEQYLQAQVNTQSEAVS